MRPVKFQPIVEWEIDRACARYTEQDVAEVVARLLEEIDRAVAQLEGFAHMYSAVDSTESGFAVRRIRLWTFPFMLVYVIDPSDVVQVFAFAHLKQERFWRHRVP